MQVEEELGELSPERDMLITIGVFDGVHLGHKYLISQLKEHARQQNLLTGVVTFRQHPLEVLSPQTRLPYLTNLAEKVKLLKEEGVDAVIPLTFNQELANLSASQFVGILKKYLRMRGLIIGPDFTLGQNREGNAASLKALGQDMNFSVMVIDPKIVNNEVVSSTAIRDALADGNIKRVVNLIGHPFSLKGQVTSGAGSSSRLDLFPTANLDVDPGQAVPANGVYATRAHIEDKVYQAVTNIGWRPTFDGDSRTIETYILNYQGNLYGRELKIDFVERLRDENRFDSAEELKKQITKDIKQGKAILDSRGKDQYG
ncbi:bifunctional riboflavin kinase/FAD synthetase [Chloroflexota bacterium]